MKYNIKITNLSFDIDIEPVRKPARRENKKHPAYVKRAGELCLGPVSGLTRLERRRLPMLFAQWHVADLHSFTVAGAVLG
jgi:hypothetical protein